MTYRLASAAALLAVLAACSPPDPCSGDDGCAEPDAGEGEGEGEGELDPIIERACAHLLQCDFVDDLDACRADAARNVEIYAPCDGFTAAYDDLVACTEDAACGDDAACATPQAAMNDLLLDCVTADVDDEIDRVCAVYDDCNGPDPSCPDLYAEQLVPAGPDCPDAHAALAQVADCLEGSTCDALFDCDPDWEAYYDAVFFCRAGPPPPGEPFAEGRAYAHELIPADECNPEIHGNCNQTADFCPDGSATYVVTDILLEGLYARQGDVVTLNLSETGGETSDVVTFTVVDGGATLIRDDDGAEFVRQDFEPFCE